jgi:hypothetical protein
VPSVNCHFLHCPANPRNINYCHLRSFSLLPFYPSFQNTHRCFLRSPLPRMPHEGLEHPSPYHIIFVTIEVREFVYNGDENRRKPRLYVLAKGRNRSRALSTVNSFNALISAMYNICSSQTSVLFGGGGRGVVDDPTESMYLCFPGSWIENH